MPVVAPGGSDSATFDNVLELLVLAGRPITHAVMMMVPEAYRDRTTCRRTLRGFYDFHSCLMEPWDGPAVVAFTDGRQVGATLDRNGLRPGRWVQTTDGYVVLASETGVLEVPRRARSCARAACSRARSSSSTSSRAASSRTRRSSARSPRQRPYGEWYARARRPPRRAARARRRARRASSRCARKPARVRLLAGGPAGADRADGGATARSRSARWATTPRWPCCPTASRRCSPTSSSCSRRSRTRRSTRSARRS